MSGLDDNVAIIGDWIPFSQNNEQGRFSGSKEMLSLSNSDNNGQLDDRSNHHFTETGSFSDYKLNSRGGLVERMAARAGFNAPRLNTEGIRPNDVLNSDSRSSPLLMISPGLSPTSLLESPVFLSNSLAQPSPTTGKFPLFPTNGSNNNNRNTKSTLGGPPETNTCRGYLSKDIGSASFAFKPSAESAPSFFGNGTNGNELMFPQQSLSFPRIDNSSQSENSISLQPHNNNPEPSKMQPPRMFEAVPEHGSDEQLDEEGGDQKVGNGDSVGGGAQSEDGYNWRKYGQKQVKGSEFPRSYYKCTNPNCPVKKKVERSHEGHITEIIYKGAHNHPKPPPGRRAAMGGPDISEPYPSGGDGWKQDNFEVTSSPSEGAEFGHQTGSGLHGPNGSGLQGPNGSVQFEVGGGEAVDASSTFSNEEVEDDQATNGSVSLVHDAEGEESESKRRKIEVYPADMSGATRAIREPRVVVQTTSEVDILDDGYRWRKYGQKVVKGNPNPRSYYKCTSPGCSVRKHVERASHDLKSVITTYEGKHNHDVPAARNSSHGNSGASGSAQPVQPHRPEHQMVHNVMPRFDASGPLTHFGLPGRPLNLGHGVQFGMGGPSLPNFGLAGMGPVHGKVPMHPFLAQQQRQLSEMGFMTQKVEPGSEPGLSNSASMYQQLMSRLPMGP